MMLRTVISSARLLPRLSLTESGFRNCAAALHTSSSLAGRDETITVQVPRSFAEMQGFPTEPKQSIPRPRSAAPDFKGQAVVDRQFKEIKLSDYKGKWLVLFFYPLDFTFVCPTEIRAFSDRSDEFKKIDCEVVACSTDSHFSHLGWINTPRKDGGLGDMKIPVLSDYKKDISKAYGVLLDDLGAALRGLFVIDPKGTVRSVIVNDLPVGRSVDETLRLVQAFQFTDKNGEVCPSDWKPNSATIKPDIKGSKEYFSKSK